MPTDSHSTTLPTHHFSQQLWLARFREYVAADRADGLAYDREDAAAQEITGQRLSAAQDAILNSPATTLTGVAVQLALWRYERASDTSDAPDQVLLDALPVIMKHAGFPAGLGQREHEENMRIRNEAYRRIEALGTVEA